VLPTQASLQIRLIPPTKTGEQTSTAARKQLYTSPSHSLPAQQLRLHHAWRTGKVPSWTRELIDGLHEEGEE
jgi:hypothetical protein